MDTLLQFLLIVLALEFTPGPAVLMILFQSSLGFRHVVVAIAGLLTANIVWITLVATGLGLLITGSPQLYGMMRITGAVYLIYLGYKIVRFGIRPPPMNEGRAITSYHKSYLRGMLTSFSNPKALVFFLALFPPFVRADHFIADIVFFGALKMLALALALSIYGVLGRQIFIYLHDSRVGMWISWLLGAGIILGGLALLVG